MRRTTIEIRNHYMLRQLQARMGILPVRQWWNLSNATSDAAELSIFGEISPWGVTAAQFNQDLASITSPRINLHAIYNAIRSHPAFVTAYVDSLAASSASVILQAADRRVMLPHSEVMIHKAWGMAVGDDVEMERAMNDLRRENERLVSIYLERTKGGEPKAKKIRAAMAATTWFDPDDAVSWGLADAVEKPAWKSGPGDADEDDGDEDAPPPDEDTPPPGEEEDDAEDALTDAMLRAELDRLAAGDLEDMLT